jgi:hypothetical protein
MKRQTKRADLPTTTAAPAIGNGGGASIPGASISALIDEDATAAMLGVSARTMQRGRKEGWGPPYVRAGLRPAYRL